MTNIDNIKVRLGDDFRKIINDSSGIKICAAYFSIYAFIELKEELSKIKEFSFLFNSPTFFKDNWFELPTTSNKKFPAAFIRA